MIVVNIQNVKKDYNLVQYFKSIEKYLFFGRTATSELKNKIKFIDSNLII